MNDSEEKVFRNLQEQVGYLTEELKKIKQSLGGALPDPIEGPEGPEGPRGPKGETGRTPQILVGYGPLPNTGVAEGDIYIFQQDRTINNKTYLKGDMYQKKLIGWELKCNITGKQGPEGPEVNVTANPVGSPTAPLETIDINGVIFYPKSKVDWLSEVISSDGNGVHFDALGEYEDYIFDDKAQFSEGLQSSELAEFSSISVSGDIYANGNIKMSSIESLTDSEGVSLIHTADVSYLATLRTKMIYSVGADSYTISNPNTKFRVTGLGDFGRISFTTLLQAFSSVSKIKLFSLDQIIDQDNDPLAVIENFKDANGHNRFIEGTCPIDAHFNGTITYNKWSLSGTHLMIVLSGTLNAGTQVGTITVLGTNSIPEWILDKIYPVSSHYIDFPKIKAFSDWQSVELGLQVDKYDSPKRLVIGFSSSQTINVDRKFRYELDLLIDND